VDNLAAAVLHVLSLDGVPADMVNVGCARDLRIAVLAEMLRRMSGYDCEIVCDTSKPDGTPRTRPPNEANSIASGIISRLLQVGTDLLRLD